MTLAGGGQLQMDFQGAKNGQYVFEASTNLTDWVALRTNTVKGGVFSLIESNLAALPAPVLPRQALAVRQKSKASE
jgi:hypothetical protein